MRRHAAGMKTQIGNLVGNHERHERHKRRTGATDETRIEHGIESVFNLCSIRG